MTRGASLALCLAFLACAGGAEGAPKRILKADSPVYELMESIYLEGGLARPWATRPWAVDQARGILSEVERDGLSRAGARAYDEVMRLLKWHPFSSRGEFAFGASLELSPETFWHFPLGGEGGAAGTSYERAHGAESRKSLLNIPVQAALGRSLFLEMDIEAREEFDAASVPANHFNLILDDPQPWIDINTPFKALSSAGGSWWTIRFGRDSLAWGNGSTGDFMISDWDGYHDYLGFDLFGRTVSFSGVYMALESYAPNAVALTAAGKSLAAGGVALPSEVTTLSSLAFVAHRLEFSPWKQLRFAVSESVILSGSGANGTFGDLIHDLNPLMVYHNWNIPKRSNSLMTIEVSVNPWKYMDTYGQLAMDELTTSYEATGDGGGGPFIGAWLGGLKARIPAGEGYLSVGGEYAQTSPWLYNRDSTRNVTDTGTSTVINPAYYYDLRHYWSLVQNKDVFLVKPIGYRWGPDALVFQATLGYAVPGSYSLSLDCTWASIGQTGIAAKWNPAIGNVSPTGIAEKKTILHMKAELPLFPWLCIGGDAYYVDTRNLGHVEAAWSRDIEVAAHATVKI